MILHLVQVARCDKIEKPKHVSMVVVSKAIDCYLVASCVPPGRLVDTFVAALSCIKCDDLFFYILLLALVVGNVARPEHRFDNAERHSSD